MDQITLKDATGGRKNGPVVHSLKTLLLEEQLRIFCDGFTWQLVANIAVATACLVLFARPVAFSVQGLWWSALVASAAARFFPTPLLHPVSALTSRARHARLVAWQGLDGLLWGILIFLIPYPHGATNPPFLVAIIVGLTSGPIPFLSMLPGAYEVFVIPSGLALAWREYARDAGGNGLSMAVAVLALQVVAVMISRLNALTVRERILRNFRLHSLARRSKRREAAVRALLEASPDLIGLLDDKGKWQLANKATLEIFGLGREDLIQVDRDRLLKTVQDPDIRNSLGHLMSSAGRTAAREEILLRQSHKAPRVLDLLRCQLPLAVGGGSLLIGRDITTQKREILARQLKDRLTDASLRDESPDKALGAILSAIADHLDLLWIAMLRVDEAGIPLTIAQGGRLRLDTKTAMSLVLAPPDPPHRVVYPLTHNGLHYGAIAYRPLIPETLSSEAEEWLVRISWDISSVCELDAAQNRLRALAHYDELTGLPNRALFLRLLQKIVEDVAEHDALQALLFLDLDRFKDINDSFGHAAGDRLLIEITSRLRQTARSGDIVARLSGDEFAIILRRARHMDDIENVLARFLTATRAPIRIGTDQVSTQASIGLTVFPLDETGPQNLLRHADLAMYEAKRQGRNRWCLYEPSFDNATRDRQALQQCLRAALAQDLFVLHYQPQIELATGRVAGVEALLRWRDPNQQPQSPEVFVPIAEESGLIVALGEWVLREACCQQKTWMEQGLTLQVAVNLSPSQFQDPDIHHRVCDALQASGTAMHHITLEITERAAFADPGRAQRTLNAWQQRGLHFAIDDFGTGQASLSYLTDLPAALIKIDKGFIASLPHDPQHCTIVAGVIQMAHQLGRRVLAEGVETQAQWDWLIAQDCDLAQGFAIAHPMVAEAIPLWLTQWLGRHSLNTEEGIFVVAHSLAKSA